MLSATKFPENSNLSTTYLGRKDMTRASKVKVEEKIPISEQGYTFGKLLDCMECPDTFRHRSMSKLFMSKLHYLRCKSLHSLPKFAFKTLENSSRE